MMDLSGNTVLITGATSGIGLALAERFLDAGSRVIAVGRRAALLEQLKAKHPLGTVVVQEVDISDPVQREALRAWVVKNHPDTNILINNAGMQRFITDLGTQEDWATTQTEITTNIDAVIHLCRLFLPHLRGVERAAIMNVTSGLSFVPKIEVPVYCATKAAIHSFTISLREQERRRAAAAGNGATPGSAGAEAEGGAAAASVGGVRVIEIVPPAVNTDLGGPGLHTFGVPLDDFADGVMKGLAAGQDTVYYGFSGKLADAKGEEWDKAFAMINALGH